MPKIFHRIPLNIPFYPATILTNIQVFLITMVMALFLMMDITSAAPAPSPTITGAELFGLLAVKGLLLKGKTINSDGDI